MKFEKVSGNSEMGDKNSNAKGVFPHLILLPLICLAVIAVGVLRIKFVHERAIELPGGLQWNVSSDDPNDSVIMWGTNALMSGSIMLKIDGHHIYGLCGERAFVIDYENVDAGVDYFNHMFEIADKFKFDASVIGLETIYDYRKRSQ